MIFFCISRSLRYDCLVPGAYKADVFRTCIMNTTGGVYIDGDLAVLAPITSAFTNPCDKVQIYAEYDDYSSRWKKLFESSKGVRYNNAVLISPPGHPLWECMLQTIISNVRVAFYGTDACDITGPGVLTQCANSVGGVKIIGFLQHGVGLIGRDPPHPVHFLEANSHIKTVLAGAPHYSEQWKNKAIYKCPNGN